MIKVISKRFLSLFIILVMVISLIPASAFSVYGEGTLTGLDVDGLELTYDAGTWSAEQTEISGDATRSGCDDINATLTIKNVKTGSAKLIFNYEATGTVKINGETAQVPGEFNNTLKPNGSVKINLVTNSECENSKITISDIKFYSENMEATTVFQPAENGFYTVDGASVTEGDVTITRNSNDAYKLIAKANEGYQFFGWYTSTGKCISTKEKEELNIDTDCTITARFASAKAAFFETGGKVFADLNKAVEYAQVNNQSKITLSKSGSINEGTYEIPKGITLLIPFDSARTSYGETPGYKTAMENQIAYMTLTMSENSLIEVDGAIEVGGRHYTSSSAQCCKPTGPYGLIEMSKGSSIVLNKGSNLYAWGYITGEGEITATSDSEVYEYFQVTDWRGGKISSAMMNEEVNTGRVFPFAQYYIQNIEARLSVEYGANEYTYITITASGMQESATLPYIGKGGAQGLFQLKEGGIISRKYDPFTDRIIYETEGNVALESISLSAGVNVDSSEYVLPINNNTTVFVHGGSCLELNQDIALLPSVKVVVDETAKTKIAKDKKCYIYDSDEWGNYLCSSNAKLMPIAFSPTKKIIREANKLIDAEIDVNGCIEVDGELYTTDGGAKICSSKGSGMYIQTGAVGTASVTYQATSTYNKTSWNDADQFYLNEIKITPARLQNGDESYTVSPNIAETISYEDGRWKHSNEVACNATGATCTEPGHEAGTKCSVCDAVISGMKETEPALGHDLTHHEAKAAACKENGWEAYDTCTRCDYTTYVEIPATDHDFDITAWASDKDGHWHVCKHNGCTEKGGYADHEWEAGATTATCTEAGEQTYTCSVCKTTKEEPDEALGHTGGTASCKEKAECDRCHEKYGELAEHEYGKLISEVAATHMTEGTKAHYTCSVCGKHFDSDKKELTDLVIPKLTAHTYGEWTVTEGKEATCTEDGEETRSCICGAKEIRIVKATGHTEITDEAIEATCTADGKTEGKHCSVCNEVLEAQKEIPATGHDWETGWTVDKEATCKEEGSKSHHCSRCDAKADVTVIPMVDHNYQNGKCTYCGEVKHTSSSGTSRDYVTNVNTDDAKTTVANIIPRNNGKLNISDAVLKEIFSKAAANSSTKVVIRVHHKYTNSSSVYQINLSQNMIDNLIKDNKYELVINTGQGEFTLNAEIMKTMSAKAADGISVTSRELDQFEMTEKQKAACGEYGFIIQLIATDSKGEIIWSGNGAHTAAVEIPDKLAGKDVKILVIDKYGLYRELDSSIVEQNGKKYLSFSSDGTARYIITDSDNAVSLLDKQAQRLKKLEKGVKKTKLKLNVSVTSKGNMKLTWKKSKGYNVDYYQVYRAVKKKGFGKKAFYQNSSDIRKYINTKNLKQGKRYYYKVRGVRLVGDKLVYTGWSNIDSEIAD